MPGRFAAAKQAGATEAEIDEVLYFTMRAAARATWSMIHNTIEGADDRVKKLKARYEAEQVVAASR